MTGGRQRCWRIASWACVLATAAAGCSGASGPPATGTTGKAGAAAAPTHIRFTDVTDASGIRFAYRNGEEAGHDSILESLGGGVAMLDFDGDGRQDLFFAGGGRFDGQRIEGLPSALCRNVGRLQFEDVSQQAGGGLPGAHYSHGAYAADYDNDGFSDVLVTGYGGLQLWHNQGDGTFRQVQDAARLDDPSWSSAAAWGDFDGDGALDLYVSHYVNWSFDNHPFCEGDRAGRRDICAPREFDPLPDLLYFSNGDGTFRLARQEAGLRPDGKGLGVLVADVDQDNDVDIYVGNDTTDNFMYLNDGSGRFEESGMRCGTAVDSTGIPNGSMGLDLCDFNQDGRPDLWVTNYEREDFALYRNEGGGSFLHISRITGLNVLGGLYVGFGTSCADFDHDGDEDIVVANGHVIHFPTASPKRQQPLFLEHRGERFYRVEFPGPGYFHDAHMGRGLASGDLDGDGDLDLAVSHVNDSVVVLRNDLAEPSQWLHVRLIGTRSNRDAIGATLTLDTSEGQLVRQIKGGGSYLSTSEGAAFWGLPPQSKMRQLKVRWPSGKVSTVSQLVAGRRLTIVEPRDD